MIVESFFFIFLFLLKLDSSLIQITVSFPSTLPSSEAFPLFLVSNPPQPPFRKETTIKHDKQGTIRQGKSPHTEAGQGNPTGEKESQERQKSQRPTCSPWSHQEAELTAITYTQGT